MSKMDDMRAMREARYAASRQDSAKPAAAPRATRPTPTRTVKADVVPEAPQEGLCGHRAISGRTCTREKGHAAKSHRYS